MIGWKILCVIDRKEVVVEVASEPTAWVVQGCSMGVCFYVYHDKKLHLLEVPHNDAVKVIEKLN